MSSIPVLDPREFLRRLRASETGAWGQYYAFYSSVVGGVVTDPALMLVPIDDHLVHRGDGVFETVKFLDRRLYNLEAHLDRLFESAAQLAFPPHLSREDVRDRVLDACRAANRDRGSIRILLSRGTGGMGVNPYECPAPHLYILVYHLPASFMEVHPEGATARTSRFSVKMDFLARVKSCNYLLNALMRKEAADHGVDFVFAFDEQGHLAEGPTESVGLLSPEDVLYAPLPDRILPGTTLDRVLQLAERLRSEGRLRRIERKAIEPDALRTARELFILGTTTDVTSIVRFDDQPVGDGVPGPIGKALRDLLLDDIRTNSAMQTRFDA